MTPIVTLAVVVTLAALILKRSALAMAASLVIIGGEILAGSAVFSTFSTIILVGCAQLLLFMWCKHYQADHMSKNLQRFTILAFACAVLSTTKLAGYMLITDIAMHNSFQGVVEGFLALFTIMQAFLLLFTPTRTVALHEFKHGRNNRRTFANFSHHHHVGGHEGEQ